MQVRVGLMCLFVAFLLALGEREYSAAEPPTSDIKASQAIPILNGDFEQGTTGWDLPKGSSISAISTEQALSGTHSLKITDNDPRRGSNVTSPKVPISGEGLYVLRGNVFPVSGDGLGIYVRILDKEGKATNGDGNLLTLSGSTQRWQPFEATFFAPDGSTALQLWIHSYNAARVTAYLDDLQFVHVTGRNQTRTADLKTIKQRILDELLQTRPDAARASQYMKSLQPDGSWADIAYDNNSPSVWNPATHISRLLTMAIAYRVPSSSLAGNDALKQKLLAAYDFWMQRDFKAGNWWWNVIGIPRLLYRIMFLIEPELSQKERQQGIDILKRGQLGMTGENLVWVAEVTIARGCLMNDPIQVAAAFDAIAREIRISRGDGIQADFSFYQHGTQLYSGGYGFGFGVDTAHFARLARETSFAFGKSAIDLLSHYLLDGQQWMVRGQTFDYSACGREISRRGAANARGLIRACQDLAQLKTPRESEFETFAKRISAGRSDPSSAWVGNKHFWRSDFMTQRRPAYYTSVRMTSPRLLQTESLNGENLEGRHLSDGVNYIFLTGNEYRGIFPVWDWEHLPGTTDELLDEPMTVKHGARGERSFVGGVSDGTYGMAAMDSARGKLTAKKAWFFFDHEYVCLGAGINCPTEHRVITSLNQCLLHGEVIVSDETGQHVAGRGQHHLHNVSWMYHDGVGYQFPRPTDAELNNGAQQGSWHRINHSYNPKEISEDVFSLWLNHGAQVENASYAYIVAPGVAAPSAVHDLTRPATEILQNRTDLQAVRDKSARVLEAAFYHAGELSTPDGLVLSVDQPCLVLMQTRNDGVELAVSNPENQPLVVNVQINRQLAGDDAQWSATNKTTVARFQLPDGLNAGESVVRSLTFK